MQFSRAVLRTACPLVSLAQGHPTFLKTANWGKHKQAFGTLCGWSGFMDAANGSPPPPMQLMGGQAIVINCLDVCPFL